MKKLFTAMFALVMFTMMANAKTPPSTLKNEVKATNKAIKVETSAAKKAIVSDAKIVKANAKAANATVTTNGVKLKADGTPDKRYNKTVVVAGPKKSDGTADMRYNANKTVKKAKKDAKK